MNEKNYYSLRLLGSNAYHAKGDVLKTTNKVLNIGETADCEIRFESGQYEPERYATIVENEDGKSWRLIQRSEHVNAQIAGFGGFGFVHQLKDGDVISFDGQDLELEFHVHNDSNYGKSGVVIEQHPAKFSIMAVTAIAIATLALLTAVSYFFFYGSDEIKYNDLKKYLSSIYITRVDSVHWIQIKGEDTTLLHHTLVMEGNAPVGTAFLTTDGKLITARHCIEYWIGDDIDLTMKVESLEDNDIKKWAILSEKFMQERETEDIVQCLRVFFSIYRDDQTDTPIYKFSSTDAVVHINRSRDGIMQIVDYNEDYYWRTVRPFFNNQEMELDDIAYMDVDKKGNIELADSVTVAQLTQSSPIAVLGYPNIASGKKATFEAGYIRENRTDTLRQVSPDLIFKATISKGFSGGPVFVRNAKNMIVVAGVVSKIDTDNNIFKKAVPITEIRNFEQHQEEDRQ